MTLPIEDNTADWYPVNVTRLIPAVVFIAIFVAHAFYVGACAASAPSGWTDFGISAHVVRPLGLGAYWRGQDYFIGFSYALAAAFALINWGCVGASLWYRRRGVKRHVSTIPLIVQVLVLIAVATQSTGAGRLHAWVFVLVAFSDVAFLSLLYLPFYLLLRKLRAPPA